MPGMAALEPIIDIQILDRPVGYVTLGESSESSYQPSPSRGEGIPLPSEPPPQPSPQGGGSPDLSWGNSGGGECVFLGRTRGELHPEHGALLRLRYEAYGSMAEGVLRELAEEAVERFGCLLVRVHHAVGVVDIGEASVLVQVVCGHRGEAFEACRFLIDELKKRVPIWKKEEWADGTSWSEGTPGPPEFPIQGSPGKVVS